MNGRNLMDTIDREKDAAKQAAQQRPDDKKILRARPVKGKIDYAELSREHIDRYPKIRARLAE
jgi:hypothetical protein